MKSLFLASRERKNDDRLEEMVRLCKDLQIQQGSTKLGANRADGLGGRSQEELKACWLVCIRIIGEDCFVKDREKLGRICMDGACSFLNKRRHVDLGDGVMDESISELIVLLLGGENGWERFWRAGTGALREKAMIVSMVEKVVSVGLLVVCGNHDLASTNSTEDQNGVMVCDAKLMSFRRWKKVRLNTSCSSLAVNVCTDPEYERSFFLSRAIIHKLLRGGRIAVVLLEPMFWQSLHSRVC